MNKLRKKVFLTISFILTISLLSFIIVFNVQRYLEEKKTIERSLSMHIENENKGEEFIKDSEEKEKFELDDKIRFMDSNVYTVVLDKNNNIIDVINHSKENNNLDLIREYAKNILNSNDIKNEDISLYTKDYSYRYEENVGLIIVDNTNSQERIISGIKSSLVIFIIAELIIIIVSDRITNWIIKPVENSFQRQKEFIADASHELKTPLSVIVASAEALDKNPKEKKWLNNIKNESERMNNLIKDLLELAKTEREKDIIYQEGNLSKVIELSILTFEGRAYEKKIKLDYEIDEDIRFKMNEDMIKEVVEILLDNAIKHSNEEDTVNISLKEHGNSITFIVINNGEGIPKGEEEKIFERFYRVDKSRNRNENRYGLGLSIAKNIVENHHGTITAFSNNGKTTLKVLFKKYNF